MKSVHMLFAGITALVLAACDTSPEVLNKRSKRQQESDTPSFNVRNGVADQSNYPFVGALVSKDPSRSNEGFCSGSLISPRIVLTAAHCVYDDALLKVISPDSFSFTTRSDVRNANSGSALIGIESVMVSPLYVADQNEDRGDLALIKLKQAINLPSYPVMVLTPISEVNTLVTFVGYGFTADSVNSHIRRSGQGNIFAGDSVSLFVEPGAKGQITCSGDSGGPLIDAGSGSSNVILGVTSSAYGPDRSCKNTTAASYVTFAHQKTWIENTINSFEGKPTSLSRWQNPSHPLDINNDGHLTPMDALLVINFLNRNGAKVLTTADGLPPQIPYLDADGNGMVSPLDALRVINDLNNNGIRPVYRSGTPAGLAAPDARRLNTAIQSNDLATIRKEVNDAAYKFDQKAALRAPATSYRNLIGMQEKWINSNEGWMIITPEGLVYRYLGYEFNRPKLQIKGYFHPIVYENPVLLTDPTAPVTNLTHTVFVTSSSYTGNLGGIAGADAKCNSLANAAGLGTGWKALISDSRTDARSRISIGGPVHDLNGVLLAADAQQFWSGNLRQKIAVDQRKRAVRSDIVYTGTIAGGTRHSGAAHCADWTSGSGFAAAQAGRTDASDIRWLQIYNSGSAPNHACSNRSRLYCVR